MTDANQMNPLFFSRTVSQVLQMSVIPEIEKRIANGKIAVDSLPMEIKQFRTSQKEEAKQRYVPVVEINDEVKLITKVKFKRTVQRGMPVTLADIDPAECYLNPPMYDGKPAGYLYWRSMFLDSMLIFDFEYNTPDYFANGLPQIIYFPILEFLNADNFIRTMKPLEKFRTLSANNWPPAPGYCPKIMQILNSDSALINSRTFVDTVSSIYNLDYWKNKLAFWAETDFFPKRNPYIERAIQAHYHDDYIASIYVIVPQFEGIITDYLKSIPVKSSGEFPEKVRALKDICLSRKIMLYPREVLEIIFDYIENGSFWKYSGSVGDPKISINRHGIAHGVFTDFECKEISLKYLVLFDALAYVLLNDKIVSGKL